MKRLGVLLAAFTALIGVPALLLAVTGTPWSAAKGILQSTGVQAQVDRALPILGVLLWCGWTWIVLATVVASIRHRQGVDITSVASSRLISMFVVALWMTLVPRQMPGQIHDTRDMDQVDEMNRSDGRLSLTPLALTASVFAVAHVLRSLGDAREARIKRLSTDYRFRAAGSVEAASWRSLLMAARRQPSAPCAPTLEQVPIGVRNGTPVTVALRIGESIGIEALVDDQARAVARHAQWMLDGIIGDDSTSPTMINIGFADGQRVQIAQDELGWRLVATGERFDAFGISDGEERMIDGLREAALKVEPHRPPSFDDHERVLVRVMGPVLIESTDGTEMVFEKSRSIELLAWLVTHRDRPTRAAARTAMWESDVQNATFNNIVSDLRTGLQHCYIGTGIVALEKSFDEQLKFDSGIVSDADLLDRALHAFIDSNGEHERRVLRSALRMVREMPFLGSDYLWPDPEGITSNIVHVIVSAAMVVTEDALERGEFDEVFFATGQGLKVLRNHEGLIGMRMRAYAKRDDLAGVRHEWERYAVGLEGTREEGELRRLRDELLGIAVNT